jgi:hypothetical protein
MLILRRKIKLLNNNRFNVCSGLNRVIKIIFLATLFILSSSDIPQAQDSDGEWSFRCYPKADLIKANWPNSPYKNLFEIIVSGYCAVGMEIYGGPWNITGPTIKYSEEGQSYAMPPKQGWWPVIFKGKYDYQSKLAEEEVILVQQYKDDPYSSYKPVPLFSIKRTCPKNPWIDSSGCNKSSSGYLIDQLTSFIAVWYYTKEGRIIRAVGDFPLSSLRLSYKDRKYLEHWITQPPSQKSDLGMVVDAPKILSPEPNQNFESYVHIVLEPPPNSSAKKFQLEFEKYVVSPNKKIWERQIVLQGTEYPTVSTIDDPYGIFIPSNKFGGYGKWRLRALIAGYGIPSEYRYFNIISPSIFKLPSEDLLKDIAGQSNYKSKNNQVQTNVQKPEIAQPLTYFAPAVIVKNIVAANSRDFKNIQLNIGEPVNIMIEAFNHGKLESKGQVMFSVTCKVLEGGPNCPVNNAPVGINLTIPPAGSHRFRVLGKYPATAGKYNITVVPEDNPNGGLSVNIVVPSIKLDSDTIKEIKPDLEIFKK